jgi:hypothetical protein
VIQSLKGREVSELKVRRQKACHGTIHDLISRMYRAHLHNLRNRRLSQQFNTYVET